MMAVEAMRSLMKLAQMKGESPRELRVRVELPWLSLKKLGKMFPYKPTCLTYIIRKIEELSLNESKAENLRDEVLGSCLKHLKDGEELSDWEEDDEIPLPQLQKQ